MTVKLSHCFITVHDQDEALTFYRDLLGLQVSQDVPIGSMRWLTVAAPSERAPVEISLETPEGRPGDVQALERVVAAGSLTAAVFETDDCDAIFDRARSAGAEVVQEPLDQPYGVRDCAVRDPSGNMVRFSQPLVAS
jgi:catechol 2,3-dioxygenase-like lactoylglutathione lyase family enzyme